MLRHPAYNNHWEVLKRVYGIRFADEADVRQQVKTLNESGGVHPWGAHYRLSPFGSHEADALLCHMKDVQKGIEDKQDALRRAWEAMIASGIVALAPMLYLAAEITGQGVGFSIEGIDLPPSTAGGSEEEPSEGEPLTISGDMLFGAAIQLAVGGPFVGTEAGLEMLSGAMLHLADVMVTNGMPGFITSSSNMKSPLGFISLATRKGIDELMVDSDPAKRKVCHLARLAGAMDVELHFRRNEPHIAFGLAEIMLEAEYNVTTIHYVLGGIDDEIWRKLGRSLRIGGRVYRSRDARAFIDLASGFAATEKLAKAYRDSNTVMTSTMRNQFPILGVAFDRPDVTIEQVHLHQSASAMRLKAPSTDATAPYGCLVAAAVCLGTTLLLKALPGLVKDL